MSAARQFTRSPYPAFRRARWRRWLVMAALVCTVGIYSIGLTHHHKTLAAELQCPVCHVMAHGTESLLRPSLTPALGYNGWYRHVLPCSTCSFVPLLRFNLRPQPRAPPLSAPSLV